MSGLGENLIVTIAKNMNDDYSKREIDHFVKDIKETLERIEIQTTKHNGRLSKVERILLILGTAVGVLLVTNGSQLLGFFKLII